MCRSCPGSATGARRSRHGEVRPPASRNHADRVIGMRRSCHRGLGLIVSREEIGVCRSRHGGATVAYRPCYRGVAVACQLRHRGTPPHRGTTPTPHGPGRSRHGSAMGPHRPRHRGVPAASRNRAARAIETHAPAPALHQAHATQATSAPQPPPYRPSNTHDSSSCLLDTPSF